MRYRDKLKRIVSCILVIVMVIATIYIEQENRVEAYTEETTINLSYSSAEFNPNHTHIWIPTYDNSTHWEYCSICNIKRNEYSHSYTDNGWTMGTSNDCHEANVHSFICSCGYSYTTSEGRKSHSLGGIINESANCRSYVYRGCYCGYNTAYLMTTQNTSDCHIHQLSDGRQMNASVRGTCAICGYNNNSTNYDILYGHSYTGKIVLEDGFYNYYCSCGKYQYSPGESGVYATSNKNVVEYVIVYIDQNSEIVYSGGGIYGESASYNVVGDYTYLGIENGKKKYKLTANITFNCNKGYAYVGGFTFTFRIKDSYGATFSYDLGTQACHPDFIAPTISNSLTQVDDSYSDGWSTAKTLTFSGTETWCNSVSLKLKDANNVVVASGTVPVTSDNWSWQCKPNIESINSTFTLEVTDALGNMDTKNFVISNIDSKAPSFISMNDCTSGWSKSKQARVIIQDDGIGRQGESYVYLGINELVELKSPNLYSGTQFYRDYKFTGDVYGIQDVDVIMKDAIGNQTKVTVQVGYLDNTAPTMENINVDFTNRKVTMTSNDYNTVLQANGSGVAGYRYIMDNDSTNYDITSSMGTITTQNEITHDGSKAYIHIAAYDSAGNIGASYTRLIQEYKVNYYANGGINAPSQQTKIHGTDLILSSQQPTRTGYTFKGWSTSSTSTTVAYSSGDTYNTNANIDLYAVWQANTYKLELYSNGVNAYVSGVNGVFSPTEVSGIPMTFNTGSWNRVEPATRVGYDFKGYFDDSSGGIKVYNIDGYAVQNTQYFNAYSHYINTSDLKVYAQWSARNDIHYEVNHYLMDINGSTYTFKEKVSYNNGTSDESITISNYKKVYNGFTYDGGIGSTSTSNIKPSSYENITSIKPDGTLVINLFYTRNKYNVTLDLSGGHYSNNYNHPIYNLFYQETKDIIEPKKNNCKFIGWTLFDISNEASIVAKNPLINIDSIFKMGYSDSIIKSNWSVLPVFSETTLSDSFYEGQNITVNMLKRLITVSDTDRPQNVIPYNDVTLEKVEYMSGTNNTVIKPDINTWTLDTSTSRLGDIKLTFSVKDVLPDTTGITDKKDNIVTIEYVKTIHLLYNDLPSIELEPYIYTYNGDTTLTKDTIETFIKDFVTVKDAQDDVNNEPWWNNLYTKNLLRNNIKIEGVSDIGISESYLKDNPSYATILKNITNLKELYALKTEAPNAFNAITSYRVTVDVKDQWGKYASGLLDLNAVGKLVTNNPSRDKVQSKDDRTLLVICTNDSIYNNAYDSRRFISSDYLNTINKNSYWGEYGKEELESILKKGEEIHNGKELEPEKKEFKTFTNKDGTAIKLIINDYVE